MERLPLKRVNNLSILAVFAMALSGILSAAVVVADGGRPDCYQMLWLLPATFCLDCILVYPFRKLLFGRISLTMIVGLYWLRMVVSPVCMVLGEYSVIPENTSWQSYLDQAFILESYESLIVFLVLLAGAKYLDCENRNVLRENAKKIRYSAPFYIVFGCVFVFFFGMILDCPDLIRYQFITILGAPDGWKVELEQRSLSGSGSGPLGVLVTLWCNLILIMQILLPAYILTWILNHRKKWSRTRIVFSSFILIGTVFVIATESRGYSVVTALALLLTLMAYSDEKQLRIEKVALVFLGLATAGGLWYKQGVLGSSGTQSGFQLLSKIMTAYFSGPQNIAASIQTVEQMGGPDPMLILADVRQAVPFLNGVLMRIFNSSAVSTNTLFNRTLYGAFNLTYTDQIVPAIGQGCICIGYLLAPLFPAVTVILSVWFERKARLAEKPIWKNICYTGAEFMAFCQVSNNLSIATQFLWYVAVAALFAAPLYIRGKRGFYCNEY